MNLVMRSECCKCKSESDPIIIKNKQERLSNLIGSLYTGGPCVKCKYDVFKVKSVNFSEPKDVNMTVIKP